jgi:methylenetetrahydrofolate reductase (NADPH)
MAALAAQDEATFDPVARIAAFMDGFSIEATRPSDADIAALATLKRGDMVRFEVWDRLASVRTPLRRSWCGRRLRAGATSPCNFAGIAALDDFLARLNGEAGVTHVLVIAGDRAECGPLRRALDAIDGGALPRRGIRTIGVAGYPEGHPRIGEVELNRALGEKIAAAEATGLTVEIVTQFCFNAGAILDFLARLRAFGFEHPVRVGLVGPTGLAPLLRYAARCGVRTSAQALVQRSGLLRQMFAVTTPDDLVRALAEAAPAGVTPHFFSFGGVRATARWARAVAGGSIALK